MSWRRFPLCFELCSPLHIGYLPNRPGTVVAQTRCYVPGKNLWGALTARITSRLYPEPMAESYRAVGQAIREQAVLSYCYLSDGEQIFMPEYADSGLVWGSLTDRQFRAQFIGARVSTAIGETGGARDATLHEIEFVKQRIGSPGAPGNKVYLVGAAWVRPDARIDDHAQRPVSLAELLLEPDLVVGGERNYGFGRLRLLREDKAPGAATGERWPQDPEAAIPFGAGQPLTGHAPYQPDRAFRGEIEIIAGREYPRDGTGVGFRRPGSEITTAGYAFAPGTRLDQVGAAARLDPWGCLIWV